MILVNNLSKEFVKKINKKEKITFLADDNISFNANEGEIVGILGPNGAGKTTLLRMIAGIMTPTKGSIIIDNMIYSRNETEIKKEISFLSNNTKLYKDISCYELLEMCGHFYGMNSKLIQERIKELETEFNLSTFMYQKISSLSTGQTQRVSLARAVLHNPKYYILDEPTSGLDIIASEVILNFIKEEKKKGKCILYSTHYMEEAENICDRVILLNNGKIIANDIPKNIKKMTNTNTLREAFFALIGGSHE